MPCYMSAHLHAGTWLLLHFPQPRPELFLRCGAHIFHIISSRRVTPFEPHGEQTDAPRPPLQGTRSACVYLSCFRHATSSGSSSSTPFTPPPFLTSPSPCASCSIYFCHYISKSSCRCRGGARNNAGTASGPICKTIWRVPKLFKQI